MTDGKDKEVRTGAIDRAVVRGLVERSADRFVELLERALGREHDLLIAEVTRRFKGVTSESGAEVGTVAPAAVWVEIESLSRLRGIVGGRFQNLRDRWVGAGFPLREHRGDKQGEFSLNEAGWIELSNWVLKQGFETRLTPDKPGCLFELRATQPNTER